MPNQLTAPLTALVDLDIVLYRGIYGCIDLGIHQQRKACENIINGIIERLQPKDYTLVCTGPGNFRKKVDPTYKAHRKPPPETLPDVRNYFVHEWGAIQTIGMEADDYIAMHSSPDTVIVSSDKDYLTVPNTWFFNPWKNKMTWNDEASAIYHFYMQCLTGDTADNVKGIYRIGPKTAEKMLQGKTTEEMKTIVLDTYRQHYPEDWWSEFDKTATLLFLRRSENATYDQYNL